MHTLDAPTRTPVLITHRTQHPTPAPAVEGPPLSPTDLFSASDSTTSTTTTNPSVSSTTSSSSTPPSPPPEPTPQGKRRPQPGQNPRQPPKSHPNPWVHHSLSPLPNSSPSRSPAPQRQREPNPPRTSSPTSCPSHPRPGSSSAQHGAHRPSLTPPPPPSLRSAPRPWRNAPRPAVPLSPHPRPADHPRPDQNGARVHQQRPCAPTNPRCQPTSSRCPATAATANPNPTPRQRQCARTHLSTSAHALAPHAPPLHRTMVTLPGPPPPPVPNDPTTPTHAHSSAQGHGPAHGQLCQPWTHTQLWELRKRPGQSPPSRAWYTGRRGGGCHRPHGKPCWPMRSTPTESTPASSPHPRTTRMSSDARGRPSK